MTQGTWPDPRRGGGGAHGPIEPAPLSRVRRSARHVRAFAEAVGWPLLLAVSFSLPATLAVERAFVVSLAVALLVGERWREAQRQREAELFESFLRALGTDDGAFAPTVDAGFVRPPLGRPRPRQRPPSPPPSLTPAPSVHERPTRVERPSERPTIPDSVRSIHVGLVPPGPRSRAR